MQQVTPADVINSQSNAITIQEHNVSMNSALTKLQTIVHYDS